MSVSHAAWETRAEHRLQPVLSARTVCSVQGSDLASVRGPDGVSLGRVLLDRTGDRVGAVQTAESMMVLCQLHDLTDRDLRLGLQLLRDAPRLHGRDALHAATALNRGIDIIISPDSAFDTVQGLRRLDPIDAASQL